MDIFSLISKLGKNPSPSGFEHSASKKLQAVFSRFFEKTEVDFSGNVYGIRKCGKRSSKCLLLDAHIDEIGLVVTGSREGFLTFATLGGVDPRILPASEVSVLTDPPKTGIITSVPPHLLSSEEKEKAFGVDELYIDIGSEKDGEVPIGTPAVFASDAVRLRENNISARALDDRASLAAILSAIDMLKEKKLCFDIVVAASTREELGCRGAMVSGYKINPDWAVVVDVTHAATPGTDKALTRESGSGVAIGVGHNMTKKVSDALLSVAKEKRIPHTVEVCSGNSGTNAWAIQVVREGIATGLLSIPLKYMHTPVETIRKKDVEATAKLIYEFILHLSSGGAKL